MEPYKKIGSKFKRKYGKTLPGLAKDWGVCRSTISKWERCGFDVEAKAKAFHLLSGNKRLQQLWHNIQQRCGNPNDKKYKYYGGRGIKVYLSKSDLVYLWNRDGAGLMDQPSIDRIENDLDYTLTNCRFIEMDDNRKRRWTEK
jgi:hypothetical protein